MPKVKQLNRGDHCIGPTIFTEQGVIDHKEDLGDGIIRIYWTGGTYTDRPKEYVIYTAEESQQ